VSFAVVLRLAFAIVFDALAFIVWDVGTRPPLTMARDVGRALREPRLLAAGLVRFAIGLCLLVFAALIAAPAMPSMRTYTILETAMLIAALVVEQLIGNDLRGALGKRAA
jgi:hypothetical protein